jgi:hypothetical protein
MPGHRYMQGLSLPKLHGTLVAVMSVGPALSDLWGRTTDAVLLAHQKHRALAASKRLWVEVGASQGLAGEACYISLDPGEYRRDRPDTHNDIIVTAPAIQHASSWRELIAATADEADADEFFATETLTSLIAQARDLLKVTQLGRPAFAPMTHKINTLIADADSIHIDPEVFQSLYQDAVPTFQFPVMGFATAELLLRAQLGIGFRFDSGVTGISAGALSRWLMTQEASFVDGFVDFLAEMGRITFSGGKTSVREALAQSTVYAFQRRLLHAVYCYSVAMYAGKVAQDLKRTSRLRYEPLVAEESLVCTITGLSCGAKLALDGYEAIVDEIRLEIQANRVEAAYRVAHQYSSEIFPILPETVLEVFVARALVENRGARLHEGVQKLETLWQEQQLDHNDDYERSLVETGLLDAYKAVGDESKARRMATRIAGRMLVGRDTKTQVND